MKQDDIARVLNVSQSVVSRPLKEHRVAVSEKGNGLHGVLSAWNCSEALWYVVQYLMST